MPNEIYRIHSSSIPRVIYMFIFALYFILSTLLLQSCATTPSPESMQKSDMHNKLAESYLDKEQLNEAFVELQKALKINPDNKETLNYLGYISAQFGKHDDAVSYYKRAISVDPDYSEAYNNLGVTYAEIQDWENAIISFKSALSNPLYSSPASAYSNMGYAYYKKGDYLKAEQTLKDAIIRNPVSPRAMYVLGLVYTELENTNAAIEYFSNAIGILPYYLDAHWELANAYIRSGNSNKALKHFKIIAEKERNTERSKEASEYIDHFK